MAETNGFARKRLHSEDDFSSSKRPRSNNGSPAPAANNANAGKPDVNKIMSEARAKAAAVAARLATSKSGLNGTTQASRESPPAGSSGGASALSKMEQLKARVAAAVKAPSDTPNRAAPSPTPPSQMWQTPERDDSYSRARGGLDVGLHPALMGDAGQDSKNSRSKQGVAPRFATTMANRRTDSPAPGNKSKAKPLDLSEPVEDARNNQYHDPRIGGKSAAVRNRYSRKLVFNQKGKYIQQANALRRQAALEQMKKRIAASSRKAGIDEDLDLEKAFVVQKPPDIEWWDEGLVEGSNYDDIEDNANLKVDSPDSIITVYVQHPIMIEPPQEKNMPAPKPMYLTPKEQAKVRRQRRNAELKEQQAKIRLGLEPAPPPKVKKTNMMRVLGEEAVKDPTAVETRVNREIADRAQGHVDANEERKLTKEQRHDKLATNQEKDAAKGIRAAVFRIDNLANGRHRFKISKNAEQQALTGICILHPKFNVVVVEGGEHSMRAYKKLMINRIDWSENSPSIVREGNQESLARWLQAEDDKGVLKDLTLNECKLLWEGEVKSRGFRKWGSRVCETDSEAREALARGKYDNFWALAKSSKPI